MDVVVPIKLPDDLTDLDSERVSRDLLEQVVAESYRRGVLSLKQVRELLGFSSRFEADRFIHSRKATGYDVEDLKADLATMRKLGLVK